MYYLETNVNKAKSATVCRKTCKTFIKQFNINSKCINIQQISPKKLISLTINHSYILISVKEISARLVNVLKISHKFFHHAHTCSCESDDSRKRGTKNINLR